MFGERIASERARFKLNQEEFGNLIGVAKRTIYQWEKNITSPNLVQLKELAKQGVDSDYIATGRKPDIATDDEVAEAPAHAYRTDTVDVPLYDVELSAGHGTSIHDEEVIDSYTFKRSFIKEIGCRPDRLAMAVVRGDSMEPTLEGGDYVLLDTRVNRFYADGIYAIRYDDSLMIKRLAKQLDGSIEIISDNKKRYDKMVVTDDMQDKFAIVGYLVNFSRGNKTCYTPSKNDSG